MNSGQIAGLSRSAVRIAWAARFLAAAIPLGIAGYWWAVGHWGAPVPHDLGKLFAEEMTATACLLGGAASVLSALPAMAALLALADICAEYGRGALFSAKVLGRYRILAWSMLATAIVHWLQPTFVGLALSALNPPGQKLLVISVSSDDFLLLLASATLFLLGRVMGVAREIEEDNATIL